jgi:hypothetical protein
MAKKAAKADLAAIEYLFGDLDPKDNESQDDAKARYLAALDAYSLAPTAIIDSGNGVQPLWRLQDPIKLAPMRTKQKDGSGLKFPPETEAAIADVEDRTKLLMQTLGSVAGTQNIDRILRLPGTINLPNAVKIAKGRVPCPTSLIKFNGVAHPFESFPKPETQSDATTPQKGTDAKADTPTPILNIFDRFAASALPDELKALIRDGVVIGKRSDQFHHAVGWLKGEGWTADEIVALLRKYPKGIASKYVGRIKKEIQRSFDKTHDPVQPEPEVEIEPEPTPEVEPEIEIEVDVEIEPEPETEIEPEPEAPKPNAKDDYIVMKGGKLVPIAIAAEAALIKSGARICQRKAHLVRPVRYKDIQTEKQLADKEADKTAIHRDRNAIVLQVIEKPHQLIGPMSTACKWYKQVKDADKSKKGEPKFKLVAADPDTKYATEILSRVGQWTFPVLCGVIAAPTLDRNGNIIEKPGYNEASGLLLDFKKDAFTSVPTNPTKEDALAAMAKINHPLRGFPFDGENENVKVSPSRSVILSAILCAPIRPSLSIVPLHGISSPMAGTGKSMLSKIPGIIATGTMATALNQGPTPEEDEKRLSVALNEGDSIINLDNCDRPITGSFLCQMLTETQVQARILGLSERRMLPNNSLVIANGNNLIFMADTVRRSLNCRLNADVEHPEDREFDFSALDEVRQQRHELLIAVLTILRAYKILKPDIKLKPMGDYRDYGWIRGALVWLGQRDPVESQKDLFAFDPMKDGLANVLECWDNAYGNSKVTVAEFAAEPEINVDYPKDADQKQRAALFKEASVIADAKAQLRTALIEEACWKGTWNSKSVGKWLHRNMDKYAGGLCLKRFGADNSRTAVWAVLGGSGPTKAVATDVDVAAQQFSEVGT